MSPVTIYSNQDNSGNRNDAVVYGNLIERGSFLGMAIMQKKHIKHKYSQQYIWNHKRVYLLNSDVKSYNLQGFVFFSIV